MDIACTPGSIAPRCGCGFTGAMAPRTLLALGDRGPWVPDGRSDRARVARQSARRSLSQLLPLIATIRGTFENTIAEFDCQKRISIKPPSFVRRKLKRCFAKPGIIRLISL